MFTLAFITYLSDALQSRLPGHLRARMQERVYIELPEEGRYESYPDVRVFEYPGRPARDGRSAALQENGGIAVADPVLVDLGIATKTESYIEVIDVKSAIAW